MLSQIYIGLHVKNTLIVIDFNYTWIFSTDARKILKYQISRKSFLWEKSCSVRTERRTDMTKIIVAFLQFCEKAPEKLRW